MQKNLAKKYGIMTFFFFGFLSLEGSMRLVRATFFLDRSSFKKFENRQFLAQVIFPAIVTVKVSEHIRLPSLKIAILESLYPGEYFLESDLDSFKIYCHTTKDRESNYVLFEGLLDEPLCESVFHHYATDRFCPDEQRPSLYFLPDLASFVYEERVEALQKKAKDRLHSHFVVVDIQQGGNNCVGTGSKAVTMNSNIEFGEMYLDDLP
jgi:hypothetical protein